MYKTNGIKALALGGSVLITSRSYELPLTILLGAELVDTGYFAPL